MRSGLEWLMAVEKNSGRSHYFDIGRGPELCRCLIAPIPQTFGKSLLPTVAPDHFRGRAILAVSLLSKIQRQYDNDVKTMR